MKTLSLKLDNAIFSETEKITSKLKRPRNRYINEAVNLYNRYHQRKMLKKQLTIESRATRKDSMRVLAEFERLANDD